MSQNSACGVKCFAMWVKVQVFHNSNSTTSISELVHEMHVRVKVLSIVTLTVLKHNTATTTSQDVVQTATRSI